MKIPYLDCCPEPDVEAVKVLLDTDREQERLCLCVRCGKHWFHRFLRIPGPNLETTWYSPVQPGEAQRILEADGRPDLSFLLSRPCFREERGEAQRMRGQPDRPCYG